MVTYVSNVNSKMHFSHFDGKYDQPIRASHKTLFKAEHQMQIYVFKNTLKHNSGTLNCLFCSCIKTNTNLMCSNAITMNLKFNVKCTPVTLEYNCGKFHVLLSLLHIW